MDGKIFANIPSKLVNTTRNGQKVKVAVAIGNSFYNCILTPKKALELIDALKDAVDEIVDVPTSLDDALDEGVIQSVQTHSKD